MDSLKKKPKRKITCQNNFSINCQKPANKASKGSLRNHEKINPDLFINQSATSQKNKFRFVKKIILFSFLILLILATLLGVYFFWKISKVSSKISTSNTQGSILGTISKIASNKRIPLEGEMEGRINILLLGAAGKGRAGGNLTDTIMVASIDTKNKKTALLSLPRDLYVKIPDSSYNTKINSIYKYGLSRDLGIEPIKKTVENITGLNIHYHLVATFEGFEKFIDDIDGIVITSERDIYDPSYPGPNYSYELFALEKGTHLLDGSTALKYARERHDDPQGDFGRAKRQQQILQSVKSRIFSTKVLLNPFALSNMLDTLGESVITNISLEEMESFLELAKELDTQNVTNIVVDAWEKESLLKVSHIFYENTRAFILVPRVGNYSEIREVSKNIFNLDHIERTREEIKKEDASVAIINQSGKNNLLKKIEEMLRNKLGFRGISTFQGSSDIIIESSEVVDLSSGEKPFTLNELIQKLPAKLSDRKATLSADKDNSDKKEAELDKYDIVLIIGSDLIKPYSLQENTIEELEDSQKNQENKEILIKESDN